MRGALRFLLLKVVRLGLRLGLGQALNGVDVSTNTSRSQFRANSVRNLALHRVFALRNPTRVSNECKVWAFEQLHSPTVRAKGHSRRERKNGGKRCQPHLQRAFV